MLSYCNARTDWSSLGLIHTVATKTAILEVSQTVIDIMSSTLNSLCLTHTYIHTQTVKRKITLTFKTLQLHGNPASVCITTLEQIRKRTI